MEPPKPGAITIEPVDFSETTSSQHEKLSLEQIHAAVAVANVPALLMVVFQVTGDDKWLEEPYQPSRAPGLSDHDSGGLPAGVQAEIREAAADAIWRLQSGERAAIEQPSPDLAVRMMSIFLGEVVGAEYGRMLATELSLRSLSPPPRARASAPSPVGYKVLVIGAGVGGIIAAHELADMGIDFVILEKQPKPGGVWYQNTYPGCGVDTPSHLYSFSFARHDFSRHFDVRENIQRYCAEVLKELGAQNRIEYGVEVVAADFCEDTRRWSVTTRSSDGTSKVLEADVLISAVGVLNRPMIPDMPGTESFTATSFHTAEWPADMNLEGKRVAIVGTGASAMQIAPAIVDRVASLTIFQRSPAWIAPFEKFQQEVPLALRALFRACPLYYAWYWMRLFWQFGDKVIDSLRIDPHWQHPERSVNARNDAHRRYFTRYIEEELASRPDLVEKVMPDYPPYGKRILLDNGWYRALQQDNMMLVNSAVVELQGNAIVDESGDRHEVDVLIWATGFQPTRYISSMDVRGIGGVALREAWNDDDPQAYLGVAAPGYPNFFMLSGPNSFPGSGSVLFFTEVQMRYIRTLLNEMFERGIRAIDVTDETTRRYNDLVDQRHKSMIWSHSGMTTYYRNSRGRVVVVMPFLNVEYWNMTEGADLENYTVYE